MAQKSLNKKYYPDLSKLMAQCARNYHSLLKLVPADMPADKYQFAIEGQTTVTISRIQETRYTETLKLEENESLSRFVRRKRLLVRLYHDAQMAEVLPDLHSGVLRGKQSTPNPKMWQPDEKEQINYFLGEWLAFCLTHGKSTDKLESVRSF